jgi:tetratricopeptide (TPR) repeat protein
MHRSRSHFHRKAFLALCLLGGAQAVSQSSSNYEKGMSEFRAKNYAAAATLFAAAEADHPGATDALLFQGKSLVNLQKFPEAERVLRQYSTRHAESDDALYLLGYVLHRQNRPADSLAAYTRAAALKTPTAEDLKIVGLNYVLLADYDDAIKWLGKAAQFDPNHKDTWYYLGRAYYSKGLLRDAKRAFERALELDPRDARAENNLGLIFESDGNSEEAARAYRNAIAWQGEDSLSREQPYLNLGNLLLQEEKIEEAIPLLEKAVALAPGDAFCHLKLGTAYLRAKRAREAQRELEEAVGLAPENAAAHFQLGRLFKQTNALDRAREEFKRVEEIQSRAAGSTPRK